MKDGYRLVDCDMSIMGPSNLFADYLDPAFQSRVAGVAQGWRPQSFNQFPGLIDGMPLNKDSFLLRYNRIRGPLAAACNNRNVPSTARRRRGVGLLGYSAIRNPQSRGREGNDEQVRRQAGR